MNPIEKSALTDLQFGKVDLIKFCKSYDVAREVFKNLANKGLIEKCRHTRGTCKITEKGHMINIVKE